jgi:hypothetical protein
VKIETKGSDPFVSIRGEKQMSASRVGRYDNAFEVAEWHRPLPSGTRCEPVKLATPDRAISHGWLYSRGGEDSVVCLMHPRANFSRHYAVPGLVDAGFAVLCQNSRWLNNDATLIHERVLLDVAEGVKYARARYSRVVLLGNSGGGSLYTFYLSQALAQTGERLRDTATGEALDLNQLEMPAADRIAYVAAHPGEGHYLMHAIDPSLVEEGDPLSCDPALDMFDAANGFAAPPQSSRYSADFLTRYRAAQRARVARIDAIARARIAAKNAARERAGKSGSVADRRAATVTDFLLLYRTDADPRYVDLSLDPSARDYGSLWGRRPDIINYGAVGFSRVVSPEAWLSTWSGNSSRAEIAQTGARMTLPALVIQYASDNAIFPSDSELIAKSLASKDVERRTLPGDHYGFPADLGRDGAVEEVASWLRRKG